MELSDGGLIGNQQASPDDGADPGQYQAQLVNCSRQRKFGHHLRLPDPVCFLNAPRNRMPSLDTAAFLDENTKAVITYDPLDVSRAYSRKNSTNARFPEAS